MILLLFLFQFAGTMILLQLYHPVLSGLTIIAGIFIYLKYSYRENFPLNELSEKFTFFYLWGVMAGTVGWYFASVILVKIAGADTYENSWVAEVIVSSIVMACVGILFKNLKSYLLSIFICILIFFLYWFLNPLIYSIKIVLGAKNVWPMYVIVSQVFCGLLTFGIGCIFERLNKNNNKLGLFDRI